MVYKAPCKYFSICGGCTLQDMEQHGAYKFSLLENALAKLDSSFILHQLIQVPIRSRRRASFKLENNRLSFNKLRSHEKVAIEECLLLEDKLNNLILPINQLLKKLPGKVDGLNMLSSDTGIELLFLSKKPNNLENSQLLAKFASDHKVARIVWENNETQFIAWCKGKTGYPLVDAGMRELNATGFMHNRVRMIVASFLCKHLLIDWRWGERYFAEKLLDYELASNIGGWQWAASSGCDAAPYFRVFNPTLQQERFDKKMEYIKKWLPEFGTSAYPNPIIEHTFARERVLKRYKEALGA